MKEISILEIYRKYQSYGISLSEAGKIHQGKEIDFIAIRRDSNQKRIITLWKEYCFPYKGCLVEAPYGQHIEIKCTKCGQKGTTKNIAPLGCRTIFLPCDCDFEYIETILPKIKPQIIETE